MLRKRLTDIIIGMSNKNCVVLIRGALALAFVFCAAAAEEAEPQYSASAPDAVKESLAARVRTFYELFQVGKFRDAEAIVAEKARDGFYNSRKSRIYGFDVKSLQFTEDFHSAKVLVTCKMTVPMLGGKLLDIPVNSRWRWENGDWFIHFGPRKNPDGSIQTPFGPMKGGPNVGAAQSGASFPGVGAGPTLESLQNMVSADRTELRMSGGEPGEETISVSNRAAGPLTLSTRGRLPPGVRVVLPERVEAGAEGEVRFVYTPGEEPLAGRHSVELIVLPINRLLKISIDF